MSGTFIFVVTFYRRSCWWPLRLPNPTWLDHFHCFHFDARDQVADESTIAECVLKTRIDLWIRISVLRSTLNLYQEILQAGLPDAMNSNTQLFRDNPLLQVLQYRGVACTFDGFISTAFGQVRLRRSGFPISIFGFSFGSPSLPPSPFFYSSQLPSQGSTRTIRGSFSFSHSFCRALRSLSTPQQCHP